MALYNLADLSALLAPQARLIGLDPGARRIGVALSDVARRSASPYGTLARAKLARNAAEIQAIAARDWAHALSSATGLPVAMVDESFTTAETHEHLIGAGISRARRAELVDKMAAAAILQRALDALAG